MGQDQKLDQETINQLFKSIEVNDTNASVTLGIIIEDKDLSEVSRIVPAIYNNEQILAKDPLNIYLHSAYQGGIKTLNVLLDAGFDTSSGSHYDDNNGLALFSAQISKSLGSPLIIENANDVCWAVLSNNPDAFKNLVNAYEDHGLDMDINRREATPFSVAKLKNKDAQKHAPLDLAVMLYVAQRIKDKESEHINDLKTNAFMENSEKTIGPVVEQFKNSGIDGEMLLMPDDIHLLKLNAPDTEENIRLLLEKGAQSSQQSYFPTSDRSLALPFLDRDEFEIMSLEDFCMENQDLFPSDLLKALTNSPDPTNEPQVQ